MICVLGRGDDISFLVGFGRLVSGAGAPDDVLEHLVASMIERVGVEAAAAVRVRNDHGAELVAQRGLPAVVKGLRIEVDTIDADLGRAVLAAAGVTFNHFHVIPLVAGRDLFGAVILFCHDGGGGLLDNLELAQGLADLAAVALEQAARYQELVLSYRELRESREAMARSEKLRALGQMAAGVAHDLGNILNPLALQLELLQRKVARQDLAGAGEVAGRMREVTRFGLETIERLRAFSRQGPELESEPTDLDQVATVAVELSRARLVQDRGITLAHQLAGPPVVLGRSSELVNALVNLILNSTEAMHAGGGAITVRTGAGDGGSWVEVADTGPGMSPDIEAQVFDPFFTTKKEGTGLGLSMVYASTRRQRGRVELETGPGQGTRIRLWFPALGG
jgi:signal transduction histidine kinase